MLSKKKITGNYSLKLYIHVCGYVKYSKRNFKYAKHTYTALRLIFWVFKLIKESVLDSRV